jgi:hypothetical protein
MLEDKIDVGETDEQEMEIDLDAPEQSLEEPTEEIKVEQVEETDNTTEEPNEQPAVQADKPQDELGEYSEGVKKRIAKLTRKMREAERQKEEAITYAQTLKQQQDKIRGQYDKLGNTYTQELEAKVTNGMDAAKLAYKQAVETQDIDGQIAAQQAIAEMAMEDARLKHIKANQEQRVQAAEQVVQQPQTAPKQQAEPDFDPRAESWAQKNKWFGTDNAMTYTAFDIHKELVENEGFDPQSEEYYTEVDKRIRVAFPHKFDTVEQSTTAPTQSVASARRPASTKGRRKTVKLTPSQVAISKRLGVPLEEYAKQLAAKEV